MASLNKTQLIGQLGRDPEIRYTSSGVSICNLSIATTSKWKSRDGDAKEETEWHTVVLFDRLSELAGEYLSKGSSVYIEGRLKTRKWQDKDGNDRYSTEVVADSMQFLDKKGGSGQNDRKPEKPSKPSKGGNDMDDDIPF